MRTIPPLFLYACLAVTSAAPAFAQVGADPPSKVLIEEEELIYNVRYGFIDLGQVRIRILGKETTPQHVAYRGKALIDSYRGVPFVDLHAMYESLIDSAVFAREFVGKSKDGKIWTYSKYVFDYDTRQIIMESGRRDSIVEKRDTVEADTLYQDGLSLFFYARDQLYSRKRVNIPTLITEQKVRTYIDFHNTREAVEIDAVDYPIDVIQFEGTADFVGIFGLTGDFEGWFSNDEARVPIMAKMKVIIGSVTIELMKWSRPGWSPPRSSG
ncbi:MAG: DUF3108 domain-containing protein [Ignavibacteriae bacterium]|nr:DUF3108 domain-containing protein [Ignavibacteriota bacterium]